MHLAVSRLVELMDSSLERSRLSEPDRKDGVERIALVPFLSSSVRLMQAMWPLRTFNYSEAADIQTILGTPQNLKTAFFNLLDNARKYSQPNTPIEVESRVEQGFVAITIQNQGETFTAEEGDAFFEKYTRGLKKTDFTGAGVGLWLVRQIIQQHNGQVRLEASGSRIYATVRLPLADETVEDQA